MRRCLLAVCAVALYTSACATDVSVVLTLEHGGAGDLPLDVDACNSLCTSACESCQGCTPSGNIIIKPGVTTTIGVRSGSTRTRSIKLKRHDGAGSSGCATYVNFDVGAGVPLPIEVAAVVTCDPRADIQLTKPPQGITAGLVSECGIGDGGLTFDAGP